MTDYDFNVNKAVSRMQNAVNDMHSQISEETAAKAEYQISKDNCLFETRSLLEQMQKDSLKDSRIQTRRFIIQTVLSVAALIAAVVAAVAAVIPLI